MIRKLDRLGRSLKNLTEWIQYLDSHGVALKSLKENIDTSTPTSKLVFHIFGALSDFERESPLRISPDRDLILAVRKLVCYLPGQEGVWEVDLKAWVMISMS